MGGGGKGGTSTTTVSIPPEVLARYNAVNARAEQVAQTPFQPYGGEFVAPMNTVQQQGVGQTQQYAQAAQPYYSTAAGMTTGAAQAAQPYYSAATGITGAALAGEQPGYQQALGMTTGAAGAAQPLYGAAQSQTLAASQPLSAQQIARYQSPYTQAVVDPTLQALRQQQGIDLARQQAQQIQTGAFGGDRAGLSRAMLQGQQELAQAQAIAPLYQQAYQNALQTAQQQQQMGLSGAQQLGALAGQQLQGQLTAGQQLGTLTGQQYANALSAAQQLAGIGGQQLTGQLSAAQQLAGIGTGAQQAGLQGAQAVIGAGTLGQQTQQALDTAQYQQFLQERGYPFQTAQFLANIAEGTGALSGSTTTSTQPTSFFSDERLKTDIKKIATAKNGLPIYSFKYKDDPKTTHIGFIAQDVEKKHPEAVGLSGGYKTVDYGKALREARAMGGGLLPSSMGGGVWPANDRQDFAVGGGPMSLQDILAQQHAFQSGQDPSASPSLPYAGMAQKGLGIPMQKSPAARAGLMKASPPSQQQQYGFRQAMGDISSAGSAASTLSSGWDKLTGKDKPKPSDGGVKPAATTGTDQPQTQASSPPPAQTDVPADKSWWEFWKAHGGGVMPHHFAKGGDVNPYTSSTDDPMEEVVDESEATKDRSESMMPKPDGSRGGGGGGGGLGSAIGTIGSLYGAAKGIGALASLLPFSDERLKNNIKKIGKTFDGQNIYSYNLGDGQTQLGLLAQEVLHHKPDAVGKNHGYLTVNYNKAVEDAVQHRATGGGIMPRQGFANPAPTGAVQQQDQTQSDPRAWDPMDLAAATLQTEGSRNPQEREAIGHVIFNRLKSGQYGDNLHNVLLARNQFEPFKDPTSANYPTKVDRNSDYFKQNRDIIDRIASGQSEDPTQGALNFWGPRSQYGLGRQAPDWGPGMMIGQTSFHKIGDKDWQQGKSTDMYNRSNFVAQPQQQYPGQQMVEGGLGAAKDLAGRMVPSDYMGRDKVKDRTTGEERPRTWGDFLTSRDFVLPLMAGLGTMASSPSRYLGAAILQGLGGAAQAYQGVQNQQLARDKALADIAQTQMQTEGLRQEMVTGSFKVQSDGRATITYRKPDGSIGMMMASEYMALPDNQRPQLDPLSKSALQDYVKRTGLGGGMPEAGKPAATTSEPESGLGAGKQAGVAPIAAPPVPELPGINVNPAHVKQIQDRAKILEGQGNAVITSQPGANLYNDQAQLAATAQGQKSQMMSFASSLAALPRGGSVLTSGKQQEVLQPLASVLNGIAATLKMPAFVNPESLANSEEVRKSVNLLAQQAAKGGNQASYAALNEIMASIPSNLNSPAAQAKLLADVMAVHQREIDKDKYFALMRKQGEANGLYSRGIAGTGADAERAFNDSNAAKIGEEKKALIRMFNQKAIGHSENGRDISVMEYLAKNAGSLSDKQKADIEKQYGTGILRYFGVGG